MVFVQGGSARGCVCRGVGVMPCLPARALWALSSCHAFDIHTPVEYVDGNVDINININTAVPCEQSPAAQRTAKKAEATADSLIQELTREEDR